MKKIIAVVLLVAGFLVGCGGSTDFFDSLVPDGARQNYEASGAVGLHLYDANAVTPVTVTPAVVGAVIQYPLSQGCTMTWDVQTIDPMDYGYWVMQSITVTYDASLFTCAGRFQCRYDGATNPAVLNGSVWDVPLTCEVAP